MKAMIHDQSLSMFLWAEACNTIVYLRNRSPHQILEDKTLEEEFTSVEPKVSQLHIFGCLMYKQVLEEDGTKMEPSSVRMCLWTTSIFSFQYSGELW